MNQQGLSSLIWAIAELLRGRYKPHEYGKVILPFTVLRRIDCVLAPMKPAMLKEFDRLQKLGIPFDVSLRRTFNQEFYNTSPLDIVKLLADQDHIKENLLSYIDGFSESVRDIFEHFEFTQQIERLSKAGLLYRVVERFANTDLHPDKVDSIQMGHVFEELLRKFCELSNEEAGAHFTPREVIRLMVDLLLNEDSEALSKAGIVRTIYDPTAGTGGMLSVARDRLFELNTQAQLNVFGQELNPESYAICKADMLIKGQDISHIAFGDTLEKDGHAKKQFDYMLSNPPFGVDWTNAEKEVCKEHESLGHAGRFGPGLPRKSDGQLLFLLHLISKMRPRKDGGSKIGIVFNGSPLFNGAAGSGESEIRRFILENDLLEAIIALPTDMFYNTNIATYVWILSNRKIDERKGKVQLIDASKFFQKMRKNLGKKNKEMSSDHISQVVKLYGDFTEYYDGKTPISRIFNNEDFGYKTITVERPLKDPTGNPVVIEKGKNKGNQQPDVQLRDTENIPLNEDVDEYFKREVLPHVSDAWIDHSKTKTGYEIPFPRHFYVFQSPRHPVEIDSDLTDATKKIFSMLETTGVFS